VTDSFAVRGVVEGFYGVFYTPPEREALLRFLGQHGYNLYIYGPKNDRQHRARWREPYPESVVQNFARAVELGRASGIDFCYAISPGVEIRYSSEDDFEAITRKLAVFYSIGVRMFSLFLDDIASSFRYPEDGARYATYAEAHADLSNRLLAWLKRLDEGNTLSMCPTHYHGRPPFSAYLQELGERLAPEIDVFYTGVDVCSRTIDRDEVAAFARTLRRTPILWDNYPVNDLAMKSALHIGPIRGRSADLAGSVKGFAVNPMIQAEASKIPLLTFAAYFTDPAGYNPEQAWNDALRTVAGEESAAPLRTVAETMLHSPLGTPEAERLEHLAGAALVEVCNGDAGSAVQALMDYLTELDEACYHLKFRMRNLALRNELLPWIEVLEHWLWAARRARELMLAVESGEDTGRALERLNEPLNEARNHHKRSGGRVLLPFIEYALEQAEREVEA
jgi:hyaluronoglucosaminidase